MRWDRILNFAALQGAWFACVLGAAHGMYWSGPIVVLAWIAIHLTIATDRRCELTLIALASALGFVVNTVEISTGLIHVDGPRLTSWFPPWWLFALWPAFASTLNSSLAWMSRRYVVGVLFGAIGGPLSYYSAVKLGALSMDPNLAYSLCGLAVSWGVAMPLLLWLQARCRRVPSIAT